MFENEKKQLARDLIRSQVGHGFSCMAYAVRDTYKTLLLGV